jgi:DNA topoisomerase-2
MKVAQLIGYVSEHSAYHHGEVSLGGTIVSMAQDFVGSNNVNLLVPSGQFGTRVQGGNDHASSRYIYTRLAHATRFIFSPLDDAILSYLSEDGQQIEPRYYVPVIPMVLVNGATGIGTGWSTDIPNYDPLQIIENLRLWIRGSQMKPMKPWYRGFRGEIQSLGQGSYQSRGKFYETDKGLEITELPLRTWTQNYKEFLQGLLPGGDGRSKTQIEDFREHHTEKTVRFSLKINSEEMEHIKQRGIETIFKLSNGLHETNMVLFDGEGKIQRYDTVLDIMDEFAAVRLKYYKSRLEFMIKKLTSERDFLSNRARFVAMIVGNELQISGRETHAIVTDLTSFEFQKFGETEPPKSGFEYLLKMPIASLTKERKEALELEMKMKSQDLSRLQALTPQQMWLADLQDLEAMIKELYAADADVDDATPPARRNETRCRPRSGGGFLHSAVAHVCSDVPGGSKPSSTGDMKKYPVVLDESGESDEDWLQDLLFSGRSTRV